MAFPAKCDAEPLAVRKEQKELFLVVSYLNVLLSGQLLMSTKLKYDYIFCVLICYTFETVSFVRILISVTVFVNGEQVNMGKCFLLELAYCKYGI